MTSNPRKVIWITFAFCGGLSFTSHNMHASECANLEVTVSPGAGSKIEIEIKNESEIEARLDRKNLPWMSSSALFRITAIRRGDFLPLVPIAALVDSFDRTPIVVEPAGSLVGEVELDLYAENASRHLRGQGLVVLWAYCIGWTGCDCIVKGGMLSLEK